MHVPFPHSGDIFIKEPRILNLFLEDWVTPGMSSLLMSLHGSEVYMCIGFDVNHGLGCIMYL